jgi:hypothetical protein
MMRERRLFEMRAGPYENALDPKALLAARVIELTQERIATWANTIQKALAKAN